jgi:hypothetical protein
MSIDQSTATALVRFTGLGIVCFNESTGQGEIAVIRDNKHTLTIKIQQPVFQNEGGTDVIAYQDIALYEQLPAEGVELEIGASGNPSIESYEIYQSGTFDRLNATDVNDFRWIVNIDDLHGAAQLSPTGEPPFPVTKLRIGNGLFYTHQLDTELWFEKVETDEHGNPGTPASFGNVAETIGVKLDGDAVEFTLHTPAGRQTQSLTRVEGLPFRIEIKNMDYNENAAYSDMPDYYGYLASTDGRKFDFLPVLDQDGGGGSVNQKQFCHPVASSIGSIDQL